MKVLITGANGQVGWELCQTIPEDVVVAAFDSKQLDITDFEAIEQRFAEVKPDVVINAAAYTAVDKAEEEPEKAFEVNAYGVEKIAKACKQYSTRLVHISTDFIYDGTKNTPYTTEDTPNPINVYGASKLEGERLLLEAMPDAVIVRTAWVYSTHGNNFVKTMLRLMNERERLDVVCDQVGTPTYAKNLAEWIWAIIEKPEVRGFFNWTDAGVASWYDFAVAVHEIGLSLRLLSKNVEIRPISAKQYRVPAKRPAFSVVCKLKAERVANHLAKHWRGQLRLMLQEIAGNKD